MSEPIYRIKNGVQSVAVFANTYTNKDGKQDTFHSLTIQRSYKDKNGEWRQQTISETPERAYVLAALIQQAALRAISLNNKAQTKDLRDDEVPF